jgi:hypothetical protein
MNLERLETRWKGSPGPTHKMPEEWKKPEGIIHDLCHVSVLFRFGRKMPGSLVSDRVTSWFSRRLSMGGRYARIADMSELRALAVEAVVLQALGAPWDMFGYIFRDACGNITSFRGQEAEELLAKVEQEKIRGVRARRVLRWIKEVCNG